MDPRSDASGSERHGTKKIYLAYDRDDAGENAARSHAEELMSMFSRTSALSGMECRTYSPCEAWPNYRFHQRCPVFCKFACVNLALASANLPAAIFLSAALLSSGSRTPNRKFPCSTRSGVTCHPYTRRRRRRKNLAPETAFREGKNVTPHRRETGTLAGSGIGLDSTRHRQRIGTEPGRGSANDSLLGVLRTPLLLAFLSRIVKVPSGGAVPETVFGS
jgi:hypothetical protein